MVDCPGDHSLCNEGLAQSYFVGDKKPSRRVWPVEPVKNIVHRGPLEILQARKR
jgi:hypothetical protein